MFKAEEHRDCTDRWRTNRSWFTSWWRRRAQSAGRPSCRTFCPLAEALLSTESRKVQNDIAPDRHVPLDKSVGSWRRGRLLRAALAASPTLSHTLLVSRFRHLSLSLRFPLSRYARVRTPSLSLCLSLRLRVHRTVQEGQHPQPSARTRAVRDAARRGEGAVTSSSAKLYCRYGRPPRSPRWLVSERKTLSRYCVPQGQILAKLNYITEKRSTYIK